MAGSAFEYVRAFEADDRILPNTWIVLRLDGRGFSKFADLHAWDKPSDDRALRLADRAAQEVAATVLGGECVLGYGQSDEFSFVLRRTTTLFGRRASKLATVAASTFAGAYARFWPDFFPGTPLRATPAFDGRAVAYPSARNLRDYLSWRQADCHVNCQYNACFWALVDRGGLSRAEAAAELKGTLTADKNELLFSRFGINYARLPARHRKGSVLVRVADAAAGGGGEGDGGGGERDAAPGDAPATPPVAGWTVTHADIISDAWWAARPHLLD